MGSVFQKAEWIWRPGEAGCNDYVVFQEQFDCRDPEKAVLRVSADAGYAVFLNGTMVGAARCSDYPENKVFDEYKAGTYLKQSDNTIQVHGFYPGQDSSVYRKGMPRLIFELCCGRKSIVFSRGGMSCAPHPHYRSGPIESITGQLGPSFDYDARKTEVRFSPAIRQPAPSNVQRRPVKILETKARLGGIVRAQGVFHDGKTGTPAQRMQYAALSHRDIKELCPGAAAIPPRIPCSQGLDFFSPDGDGIYLLIDLQEEQAGWLDLDFSVPEDCEVLIGWGEHTDDLRLRTYIGGRHFAGRYHAGAGRQQFTHHFQRMGCRYVQLLISSHAVTLFYAGLLPTVYPLSDTPFFSVADGMHRRIYETCVETLRHCIHEHYEDCPWREQALYAMDSRNQMLCGYYAFGEYDMPKASLSLLAQGIRPDHLLELCAPAKVWITIPSFSAMFIVALQEYLLYSGDKEFTRSLLSIAKEILDGFLARKTDEGLIPNWTGEAYWNFYEWQEGLSGNLGSSSDSSLDAPMNCFTAMALRSYCRMAKELGEDAYRYEGELQALKKAIHHVFWDEEDRNYYSYSRHGRRWHKAELTQALAVSSGVCPESLVDEVLPWLVDEKLLPVTLSHKIFQYEALMMRPEKFGRIVMQDIERVWGNMLARNATTFWETAKGADDFDLAGSLCHGWSAVPVYIYFAYGLGLKPDEIGFQCTKDHAVSMGLYELQGRVLLPGGQVRHINR